ncbi:MULTISPECIES: HEPN domain-containing protein [unclassified Caulobacter]|uniref:HEPN domain-containing protein n=1 Tax=unclassified Caulobacter TaxID=2648921 RepID=UPI0011B210B9|nr:MULTISPECIES: HEPN domain-containing protein [unclassified Caulobacter]
MRLLRTAMVLEVAERHLQNEAANSPDFALVSNYLAQVATVTFYAEMEQRLHEVVRNRLMGAGDEKLAYFLAKHREALVKRVKKSEIADTAAMFGADCKDQFSSNFSDAEITIYNNIITDRHQNAHGNGGGVTISDVKLAFPIAERILDALSKAIE